MAGSKDIIKLLVEWVRRDEPGRKATGTYTACYSTLQRAGIRSSQDYHSKQAPMVPKITLTAEGNSNGQTGSGYISFEKSVDAVTALEGWKSRSGGSG